MVQLYTIPAKLTATVPVPTITAIKSKYDLYRYVILDSNENIRGFLAPEKTKIEIKNSIENENTINLTYPIDDQSESEV